MSISRYELIWTSCNIQLYFYSEHTHEKKQKHYSWLYPWNLCMLLCNVTKIVNNIIRLRHSFQELRIEYHYSPLTLSLVYGRYAFLISEPWINSYVICYFPGDWLKSRTFGPVCHLCLELTTQHFVRLLTQKRCHIRHTKSDKSGICYGHFFVHFGSMSQNEQKIDL